MSTTSPPPGPHDARRFFDLLEPLCLVAFFAPEPSEAMTALGLGENYWDGYFAGRAAPLGAVGPEVVDAAFYSFGPGEVARHLPRVWEVTTPQAAFQARRAGCTAALRRILGALAEGPEVRIATELAARAAQGAPPEGRVVYAALRATASSADPLARLWQAADTLREHRGDGHVAALVAHQVGGTEAHVLWAARQGIAAAAFGRLHHLPVAYLREVLDGLRRRGLLTAEGGLTEEGRRTQASVERLTDELAVAPYAVLSADDRERLAAALAPLAAALQAAGSR